MSFPLPDGICRPVCRPKRKFPRRFTKKDVARVALAAVENGEDSCAVLAAVKEVVACPSSDCGAEWADFDAGVQAAEEDLQALLDALKNLLEALGLPRAAPDELKDPETIAQRLLRIVRNLVLIYDIGRAISDVIVAVGALSVTVARLVEAARSLADCIGGNR